ncbi:ArnT family glycosyltransferase [Methanooceanicella nereidis]|nr:glycosyltransferase family 39 protein [Methanocella sp. CWC-04]
MIKIPKKILDLANNHDIAIIILAFIIIILIKSLMSLPFSSPYLLCDEIIYGSIAQNVPDGKLYSDYLGVPGVGTYPPGYPLFLSFAYMLADDSQAIYHIMLVINAILNTSVIFPAYFILRKYVPKATSLAGALVITTLPFVNIYTFALLSENLFIPLFMFSIWFLMESVSKNGRHWDILASLSIAFLFITRTQGLSMLVGFAAAFAYYVYRESRTAKITEVIYEKRYLVVPVILIVACWLLYSSYMVPQGTYFMGSPYNMEKAYGERLVSSFTSVEGIYIMLYSLSHEIDYLLLSTYFAFLFVAVYYARSYIFKKDLNRPLDVSFVYLTVTFLVLMAIIMTFLSFTYGIPRYALYGRYIEPIIPAIFIFGFIAYERSLAEGFKKDNKLILAILLFILVIFFILFTIPREHYNFMQTISLYYLINIQPDIMKDLFIITMSISVLALFVLSLSNKKYFGALLILLVGLSVFSTINTYERCIGESTFYGDNEMFGYIKENLKENKMILIDYNDFLRKKNYWCLTAFWFSKRISFIDINDTDAIRSYGDDAQYVISSRNALPYKRVIYNDWSNLYEIGPSGDPVSLPYTIDIGYLDVGKVDGFNDLDNYDYRWTSGSSKVSLEYPDDMGDMNITIITSGYRPENDPAYVEFYLNGHKIGEGVKASGEFTYSYTVPVTGLNEFYQLLEIRTNTYKSEAPGVNLGKDLGIGVDKIVIDKA